MDSARLDAMARGLARTFSRRGAMMGLAGLAGGRVFPMADTAARKKKKKKKCLRVEQTCPTKKAKCCGGLTCQTLDIPASPAGKHCRAGLGGKCQGFCGCRDGLNCSAREGNTCRECGFVGSPCPPGNDDCC